MHDFDTQGDVDFLVMEYLPGGSLREHLGRGPLSESETLKVGVQVAEGLTAAHAAGVVYRDLKPANVHVLPDGRVKVLDFGVAALLQPASASAEASTRSTIVVQETAGTLPYMAPEQVRGEACDPRALRPGLSERLDDILLKCLEKDPENRYQSAKEVGIDLCRLQAPTTVGSQPVAARRRARRWVVAAAVLAAGLVAVAVALLGFNLGGVRDRVTGRRPAASEPPLVVAVLPFRSVAGDAQFAYLADGATEALTNGLARTTGLGGVVASASARQVAEAPGDRRTAAERRGARPRSTPRRIDCSCRRC